MEVNANNNKINIDNCSMQLANKSSAPLFIILSPTKALVEINDRLIQLQEKIISLETMLNDQKRFKLHNDLDNRTNQSFSSDEVKPSNILQFLPCDYYQMSAHTADLNTEFDNLESSLNNSAKNKSMSIEFTPQHQSHQLDFQLKTAKEIIELNEEKIHNYKKTINTLKSKNKILSERNSQLERDNNNLKTNKNNSNNQHCINLHLNHNDTSVTSSIEKHQDNSMLINQNISSMIRYFTDEYYESDIGLERNEEANKTIISSVS